MTATKIPHSMLQLSAIDHRVIGARQKLFFLDESSPGSCFFEPRGARIHNKLIEYLRQEYTSRGYDEVITPNIYRCKLWETSGHWEHYKQNMIKFDIWDREYSLKPMNCPAHCLMYKQRKAPDCSELPIRLADFGVLHRNEASGSLKGLTRVRRFQQDDAHIFCTPQQVEQEVHGCLDFARQVYGDFGFTYDINLSLRPEKFLGDDVLWDQAEQALRVALQKSEMHWNEQAFEGAFYGPKIDLAIKDVNQRSQQCATIQLDFQLPERFELEYKDMTTKTTRRPVMIHRAILGSLERFIAMLAENYRGRWPFWLSPLQAQVIPIHESLNDYARQVAGEFRALGFWVDCDLSCSTLNAKVREASLMPYNLILIVGDNECKTKTVTVRVSGSCSESGEKKQVHNLNIDLSKLKEYFTEFDRRRVDRADRELLSMLVKARFE